MLALCACEPPVISYPPPEQRHPGEGPPLDPSLMMVELHDVDAQSHYVKDILPGEGWWRWTSTQPTVTLLVYTTKNLKFVVDFALYDAGMKQTGPVELTFAVNNHPLDKIRYDTPGVKHFEKPVPPEWLRTDVESLASVTIDKLFTAPEDGKQFGFILTRIGFEPR